MSISFGIDPITERVRRVLEHLASGSRGVPLESRLVDLKEEAGRLDRQGSVRPGEPRNEDAAGQIDGEASCLANTPGGGALIMGVSDSGDLIGTELDVEWLRHRVYELTDRALTLDVTEVRLDDVRLLVIRAPQAIEPIRWQGRLRWRVDDHCVEIDPATWHAQRMGQAQFDWSAQPSNLDAGQARESSVEVARRFLRDSGDSHAQALARESTPEFLRRLNVVSADGRLTNAGVLAFVGREDPGLDYIRRDVAGGDSRQRVREGSRGLLEEVQEIFMQIKAHNTVTHLRKGVAAGQIRDLPELAIREAVANGIAHREWALTEATVVEHVGRTLRVTSPGGFVGGVTPKNIITHPSQSRNKALTELFARLRVAEREGVGVDRMVREMVRLGHRPPEIQQIDGPHVRISLVGDVADSAWIEWLAGMEPNEVAKDLNALLLLRRLVDQGWVDTSAAAPVLQLNESETRGAINRLAQSTSKGAKVIAAVVGVPDGEPAASSLSEEAREWLRALDTQAGTTRTWPGREQVARSYARARGRISTTELGSLVAASPTNVGGVLKGLMQA